MISRSHPAIYPLRRAPFTLIEILAVLAIVAVIMGITLSAVNFTPSVDASGRAISRQLFLARQYAISKRTKVAVLFPNESLKGQSGWESYRGYSRHAVRVCEVTGTGSPYTFVKHVPGTAWVYVSKGQEIRLYDPNANSYSWTPLATNGICTVNGVVFLESGSTFDTMPAIIFDSNGSLVKPLQNVTVVIRKDRGASSLGTNDSSLDNDTSFTDNEAKAVELVVRGLTGRVDYEDKSHGIE